MYSTGDSASDEVPGLPQSSCGQPHFFAAGTIFGETHFIYDMVWFRAVLVGRMAVNNAKGRRVRVLRKWK